MGLSLIHSQKWQVLDDKIMPNKEAHEKYNEYFKLYKSIYQHLKEDMKQLTKIRQPQICLLYTSYENAYWAGVMSKLEQILKDEGYDATIVGCEENSAKQIEQIENFITSGCDLIMRCV